jgi:Holliday junction resolvase RusA-like endonuclease
MIEFSIPGKPLAWARARRSGKRYFLAEEQQAYRDKVKFHAMSKDGRKMFTGPLRMEVHAWYQWPISKRRVLKPRGEAWREEKPDADNLGKLICDALEGVLYENDSQVADLRVCKRLAAQGEPARTEVSIWRLENE